MEAFLNNWTWLIVLALVIASANWLLWTVKGAIDLKNDHLVMKQYKLVGDFYEEQLRRLGYEDPKAVKMLFQLSLDNKLNSELMANMSKREKMEKNNETESI